MHREIAVLTLLVAIAAGLFIVTRAVAQAHHVLRRRDAAEWFRVGGKRLEAGQPRAAAAALRKAAGIDRDNRAYRFRLATALVSAADYDAARQVLLGLRQVAPEDPEVNLRLARLEADRRDPESAVRYYLNALYGGRWELDQVTERRLVRLELIRYLLEQRQPNRALGELLVFEGNMPGDPDARVEVARLFREAGDARRALTQYQNVLRTSPKRADALAGAGEAAFTLGDYSAARRYLLAAGNADPQAPDLAEIAGLVLARDPLAPRLAYAERRRRLRLDLADALERLQACAADSAPADREALLAEAAALAPILASGRRDDVIDALEAGVALVDRMERAALARCGPVTAVDRALLLIGGRHPAEQQ